MHSLAKTTAAALVAATAIAAPASAQDATPIATEQRAFTVASHEAIAAWSSYDAATEQFRLVTLRDRQVVPLPVAPSPRPFDVDLGTSRSGTVVAVYTREDEDGDSDLYRFSFGSGREEHLTRLSSPTADESQPTVHGGNIAFVRRQGSRDVLRIGNTTRTGTPTRALASARAGEGAGIVDPQLHARRVAYVVQDRSREFGRKTIRLQTIRTGRDRAIYQARSGGANFANVTRPSFSIDGRELYWARTNQGSGRGNRYVRYTISGGELAYERGSSSVISTAWSGGEAGMYSVIGSFDADDVTQLVATGELAFDDRP
jgi:hypothetical protein